MNDLNVADSRIFSLVVLFEMHTAFFKKALDGISDDDAQNRLDTKANHISWLAGSLVEQRYELAEMFGTKMQQSAHELFKNHQGIKDGINYPPLIDYLNDWDKISPVLQNILVNLDTQKLDSLFEMEGMKMTNFEFLSFTIYREANCIGQIALWRRLLGYPALKYDE